MRGITVVQKFNQGSLPSLLCREGNKRRGPFWEPLWASKKVYIIRKDDHSLKGELF